MRKALALPLLLAACTTAAPTEVVSDFTTYTELVQRDRDKQLVNIEHVFPGAIIDVRHAPVAVVFLRAPAANSLADVQRELAARGLGLKIFEGYRPYSLTDSRHNRGASVDITLVDTQGRQVEMPTAYDDSTPRARQDFNELPANIIANRAALRDVMTRHGFEPLASEWWHFDYHGWQKFEPMDLPLDELVEREAPARKPAPHKIKIASRTTANRP